MSYEAFAASWVIQRAVERGLEIISEASRHVPTELKALHPSVPWRAIAAIGNVLRHDYQRSEPRIVWNVAAEHLPGLKAAIDDMRRALNGDDARRRVTRSPASGS